MIWTFLFQFEVDPFVKKNHSWTFTSHALPASFSCNHVNSVLEEAQSSVNNLQPIWLNCVSGWLEMKECLEDDWKWSHMNWMIEYRIPDGRCWHRAHCTTVVEGERCPVHSFVIFFLKRPPSSVDGWKWLNIKWLIESQMVGVDIEHSCGGRVGQRGSGQCYN